MNVNGHIEDDDLALFAMRLLDEPERTAVARFLEKSEDGRRRLGEIQAALGAYAEATVELHAVPDGSLDRLKERIALQTTVTPLPLSSQHVATWRGARSAGRVLAWVGWAVAAGLIVVSARLYQERLELDKRLTAQRGEVAHIAVGARDLDRERDALQSTLSKQVEELAALRAGAADQKRETESLRKTIADQTAELNKQEANVSAERALAAAAVLDRDALRETASAQANQLIQLTAERSRAQQVLEALTDRTALRVTLTKPKAKASPTGRATYVANRRTLVFLASNLPSPGTNKVYQLWLMPADRSKPLSAGTFLPDVRGNASLVNTQFAPSVAAKGFGVTIENEGGSSTPTLPIILAGE